MLRNNGKVGLWNTAGASSPFRLTDFFTSFRNVLLPGATRPHQTVLAPTDPKYLQAFGYKKLR